MSTPLSRRTFLQIVGAHGGAAAAYRAAVGLGLVSTVASAKRPDMRPAGARSKNVVVLGAGVSGLVAAYELSRKGYRVLVLEASHRAGGRNLTLRHGDLVDEVGQPQVCRFDRDADLYFNAGAARIPGHHSALLGYCKELGVPLTPLINENRNAWVQDDAVFGGKRFRNREFVCDLRGFVAELVAKSLQPEQMLAPFTQADYERLIGHLRESGSLDERLAYKGSERAGFASYDFSGPDRLRRPLDVSELLRSGFLDWMSFGEELDQASMMMEPAGGMDRIVAAFMSKIGGLVRTRCPVEAIHVRDDGVEIRYRDGEVLRTVLADFCLNSIPMWLLSGIENNFPREYAAGLAAIPRTRYLKIGLQMKERFWESEGIYGGISWTMQDIQQIWYPSHGIHGRKGIVVGAYSYDESVNERIAALAPAERLKLAIAQAEKVHPGYAGHVEQGVSVPWNRMNHMFGSAVRWDEDLLQRWFSTLQAPLGGHYLIGDQMSYRWGWQEGAIHSAFHALSDIDNRVRAAAVTKVASHSRALE